MEPDVQRLPDDLVAHVLHLAMRPVAWPWATNARAVCARWDALCRRHQRRDWYLTHAVRVRASQ